jgi:hypothetical protein
MAHTFYATHAYCCLVRAGGNAPFCDGLPVTHAAPGTGVTYSQRALERQDTRRTAFASDRIARVNAGKFAPESGSASLCKDQFGSMIHDNA